MDIHNEVNFGTVTGWTESRGVSWDEKHENLVPGPIHGRVDLRLVNSRGEVKKLSVDVPVEVIEFYSQR